MKCRVFQMADGSVCVMYLNERRRIPGESDDAFFRREQAKNHTKDAVSFVDVEEATLPRNRTRRHAWRLRDGAVVDDNTIPDRT